MFSSNGCSGGLKYETYSSKDPGLNITMDYISGWWYSESRGEKDSYVEVFFGEPRKEKEAGRKAFISVTVVDGSRIEISPLTIEAIADDFSAKMLKFKNSKILLKSKIKLPAAEAMDIQLSYGALNKLYSVGTKLIPVKERIIIFRKGHKFYTVRYENKEEEFGKFSNAFDHIIKSIKFKENK